MVGRRDILMPIAAFIAATAVAATCAWIAGYDPLDADNWSRWDSIHYLSIATSGYVDTTTDCPSSKAVCEHAGWLPGYSAFLAVPFKLGLPHTGSAVLISWAFCLATLVLLWRRFPLPESLEGRMAVATYAAFVPGYIYMHTVFPLSLLTLLVLTAVLLLERGRWVLGALAGAGAAVTYPLGILMAPITALWLLFDRGGGALTARLGRAALGGAIVVAGFGAALLAAGLWNGDYFGYFEAQAHALRDPVSGVIHEVRDALAPERDTLEGARAAQALLTAAIAGVVVFAFVFRRDRIKPLDVLAGSYALAIWVLPLTQVSLSLYRSNAALITAAPLLRHVPPMVRWSIAGGCVLVAVPMTVLFFRGAII